MKLNVKVPEPVGFQLAAMLDVVFLLLIFFVVNQRLILNEQDLKVKVPAAAQNDEEYSRAINEMIVNVREDKDTKKLVITIDRQIFTLEQLSDKLKSQVGLDANQPVRIRGDVDLRWEDMAKVITVCNMAGVKNVSFSQQMIKKEEK